MALGGGHGEHRHLRLNKNEITGALGDSITALPLVVALGIVTDISLPHVLVAFGGFQIIWGIVYGFPISVEPMKALAALAIAGALSYAELALAGLALGIVLLVIGLSGTLSAVGRWIGQPVIRGIQFAVALLLLEMSYRLVIDDLLVGGAGVVLVLSVSLGGFYNASALAVLGTGVLVAIYSGGGIELQWPGLPPVPAIDSVGLWRTADGAIAQLAMTIGNAALATSLLVSDLFDREISPDDLASSMGVTNLVAIPAGGIPMCHGCDGVAGKYEFGARTGGANVVLGVGYLLAAFVLTTALLAEFPLALLGVLLAIVAIALGKAAVKSTNIALSVVIGITAILANLALAFLLGVLVHLLLTRGIHR